MDSPKHIWDYAIPNEIARASIRANWITALEQRRFSVLLVITIAISGLIMSFLPYYFNYIQARPGIYIFDPVLALLKPVDVSVFIFGILYVCVILRLGYIAYFPKYFMKAIWAFCTLTCLRLIVMLFVPLEAPREIIFLIDPFLNVFVYQEIVVTKDLFFSGHTATMFLLAFGVPNKTLKTMFFVASVIMASLLLMQHVHYTIDVLVAPFFSYVSWRIGERLERTAFGSVSTVNAEG